jgi:hypothetical protein
MSLNHKGDVNVMFIFKEVTEFFGNFLLECRLWQRIMLFCMKEGIG